jgi:hypothetical protein
MAAKKVSAKKAAPAKKAAQRSSQRSASDIRQGDGTNVGLDARSMKAGQDARGRASKYGTPQGPTTVSGIVRKETKSGRTLDKEIHARTQVKVPGGILSIKEEKLQRWAGRDGKPKTTIYGVVNKKSKAGDLGSQRAAQRAKKKK